jgi:hypothetical protein
MADIKICEYRNCNEELIDKRKDAKFCCRTHKDCERIYKKREKNKKIIQNN